MATYNGPFGWNPTGAVSGTSRDPNNPSQYFFQNQLGQFIGNPFDQATNRAIDSRTLLGMQVGANGQLQPMAPPTPTPTQPAAADGFWNASGTWTPNAAANAFNQAYGYSNPPAVADPSSAFDPNTPMYAGGTPGFYDSPEQRVTTQMAAPKVPGATLPPSTGQYGGVSSSMPWMPKVRAEVPGTPGTPGIPSSDTPFLTNSTISGLQTAMGPFNSQWYDNLSKSLYGQANQNLTENLLPGIQQAGQQAGQYGGGSRNSIAQGIAMRGVGDSVTRAMAPLYAQGYEANLNRNLQGAGTSMQGLLGLGNLDVNRMNAETNAAAAMANAAGAPQYNNPWLTGLGSMAALLPFLWGK